MSDENAPLPKLRSPKRKQRVEMRSLFGALLAARAAGDTDEERSVSSIIEEKTRVMTKEEINDLLSWPDDP